LFSIYHFWGDRFNEADYHKSLDDELSVQKEGFFSNLFKLKRPASKEEKSRFYFQDILNSDIDAFNEKKSIIFDVIDDYHCDIYKLEEGAFDRLCSRISKRINKDEPFKEGMKIFFESIDYPMPHAIRLCYDEVKNY